MELDLKTLSFALLLTFAIQAIAFFLMSYGMNKYKGTRTWAVGQISIALGFACIFLRSYGQNENILVIASNFFQIGGLLLFYIGTKRFFNYSHRDYPPIVGFLIYILLVAYYTFIDYQINARIYIFSVSAILLSAGISWLFLTKSKRNYRKSSGFVATIFILNAVFSVIRIGYHFNHPALTNFYTNNPMQLLTLIFSMVLGLLWVLSIIVVVNHRLYGEFQEAKNTFELIFNTIPDAIAITEEKSLKLIDVNPGFCKLTGYSYQEAVDRDNFLDKIWLNTDGPMKWREAVDKNGILSNQEATFRHKDGSLLETLLSSTKINIKEKDCILTIGRDITELKEKEQELAQKTVRLEEAITEKDKFFSILAHDLRGPIAATLNLTELMVDESNKISRENLMKYSISLNRTIASTNELLDNLLEWTKVRRGIMDFNLQLLRFADLSNQVIGSLMDQAKNKNITISESIPNDLSLLVDIHMTQSILRNLINNAIKFTREGGSIRISSQKNAEGITVFSIQDTGIGMNQNTLETLFRINFTNNRPGTNGEVSSGLGLLVCKEFVEKHGGKIWAESEVNLGSTFYFTLEPNPKA